MRPRAAKEDDAQEFKEKLLKEANVVAKQHDSELAELRSLENDIAYRSQVVIDENVIVTALNNFSALIRTMPFEEKSSLVTLLLKEIKVRRVTAEEAQNLSQKPVCHDKLQTEWHRLDFDFHITSLFQKPFGSKKRF